MMMVGQFGGVRLAGEPASARQSVATTAREHARPTESCKRKNCANKTTENKPKEKT